MCEANSSYDQEISSDRLDGRYIGLTKKIVVSTPFTRNACMHQRSPMTSFVEAPVSSGALPTAKIQLDVIVQLGAMVPF